MTDAEISGEENRPVEKAVQRADKLNYP